MWETRIAKLDADVIERQPKHVSCHLRHGSVGAGADVGCCARHLRMATIGEHDAHCDRHLQRFPHTRRHAPADQVATVPHRAWLGVALVPAERLRALAVAFAQGLAAERPIIVLVAIRITPQTKLERIELECDREFVHRTFERIDAGRSAWTAHVARGRQVEPSQPVRVLRIGAFVEQAGPAGLLPEEVLVLRCHGDRVVRDRVKCSAGGCAQLDPLNHRGPVAKHIHLLPRQHDTH